MLEKLIALRRAHLKNVHDVTFYEYQEIISDRIVDAVLQNMRITANATEEDIKKLVRHEIPIEISRQAGKTTAVVLTVEFIMLYFPKIFKRRINIGIFAPQIEQAKTDFDRLKEALFRSAPLWNLGDQDDKEFKEQSNSKTLVLPNGASCYIFPVTKTSKPESKTLDLTIFEESQDLEDKIVKEQIWPMGANTISPNVYIGTAGTKICYFYRLGQQGKAIKLYFHDIVPQRKAVFAATGDAKHLIYENTVQQEIQKHGQDSDEIARPYFGKWLIGTGQFVTEDDLDKLYTEKLPTYQHKKMYCFAGIDVAKNPDSTVVTIIRWNPELGKKELLSWLELRGDNYQDQFDIIRDFLNNYNVVALAIDSTGVGDPVSDMFIRDTQYQDENSGFYAVKFTAISKDNMYRNLKLSIQESLTLLPKIDKKNGERFRLQMLDLQQEYKGQLLSVHHPDAPDAHDDYPDSWALAEWAYARWSQNKVEIATVVVSNDAERKVSRDDTGTITDYWPGD